MIADDRVPRPREHEAGEAHAGSDHAGEDMTEALAEQFAAFRAYFERFACVKADLARARVRELLARALAMLVAILAIAATAVAGVIYAVHGMVLAMTDAFGGRAAPGYVLGGLACLLLAAGGAVVGIWFTSIRRRHELANKYEQSGSIKRAQRAVETEEAAQEAA